VVALGSFVVPGLAQDTSDQPAIETVVVTGLRASLENSQQIKQNADVFVDAITAEDIGALPDTNMSDTLQRVPGVAINHFAGTTDPDHFSVEGSGVVIRGLSYVQSEFNGRDTFSVSDGRGLSFGDTPTELWSTVLTYKDQSADMIEGGISGTVNLVSRLPFDKDGRVISLSANEEYGDLVQKAAPSIFGLYSNNWDTSAGKFGLLLSANHSQEWTRGDGSQVASYGANVNDVSPGNTVYVPVGPDIRSDIYDYQKMSWDATGQWQSNDESMLATFSFIRSQSDTSWSEHDIQIEPDVVNGGGAIPPVPGSGITGNRMSPICTASTDCNPWAGQPAFQASQFNSQGLLTNGTFSQYRGSWTWGSNGFAGDPSTPNWGEPAEAQTRGVIQKIVTEDYAGNLKWSPTDRLHLEFDAHHVSSTSKDLDDTVGFTVFADSSISGINGGGGGLPTVSFVPALEIPSQAPQITTDEYYTDPGNYFWRDNMDHIEDSGGVEDALAVDVKYDLDDGWAQSLKFGARYSNQSQTVRYTTYNWGAVSEVWSGQGPIWFAQPTALDSVDPTDSFDGYQSRIHPTNSLNALGTSVVTTDTFNNFQRGAIPNPIEAEFYNGNPARAYAQLTQQAESTNAQWVAIGGQGPCTSVNETGCGAWQPLASRPGVVPGTPFLPAEINSNVERVWAAYAMLDFAQDDLFGTDLALSGNFGFRFIDTRDYAGPGWVQFPTATVLANGSSGNCTPAPSPFPGVVVNYVSPICSLSAAQQADAGGFANGATTPIAGVSHTHDIVLPSLNAKLNITDDMLIRLGLSESIARPDLGLLRNSVVFQGVSSPFAWQVYGGNPALKPTKGDNVDLSFEWYFSKSGSFTFSPFFKQLHGVVTNNFQTETFTNGISPIGSAPGVTPVVVAGTNPGQPVSYDVTVQNEYNAPSGGRVRGIETAYQQFYSFLPAPFDGLGLNANFTYIDSTGVPQGNFSLGNPDPVIVAGSGCLVNGAPAPCTTVDVSKLPLQGLSRYNYNLTAMYQKGAYEARVAWDWRSSYLLTTRDAIYPYLPIEALASGTLDASFFYSLGDTWKFGLQATNLTNTITKTDQILTNSLQAGRSWFVSDREITFSIRAQF
jgi:TonB-dependent receptor